MCGITGIMQFGSARVEPEALRQMCAAMVHRGPDDEGIYTAVPWESACAASASSIWQPDTNAQQRR